MILTIWWPRSSVRIYQIVTGVTSDVGVPSTHLVIQNSGLGTHCEIALRWMPWNPYDKSTLGQIIADDNKSLPEPMLTQMYVTMWCHKATMVKCNCLIMNFISTTVVCNTISTQRRMCLKSHFILRCCETESSHWQAQFCNLTHCSLGDLNVILKM